MADNEQHIAALLRDTERAHGAYETTVLGGRRDESWPDWYAAYLLEHGLSDVLPTSREVSPAALAALLEQLAADYEREQPANPWPDVYARGLLAALG